MSDDTCNYLDKCLDYARASHPPCSMSVLHCAFSYMRAKHGMPGVLSKVQGLAQALNELPNPISVETKCAR